MRLNLRQINNVYVQYENAGHKKAYIKPPPLKPDEKTGAKSSGLIFINCIYAFLQLQTFSCVLRWAFRNVLFF